jgi:hypothetical protein
MTALSSGRRWKHGLYSAEALAERKRVRELLTQSRELLKQMQVGRLRGLAVLGSSSRINSGVAGRST